MLPALLGAAATLCGGFCALLGWSLARVAHASDERIRRMFDEYVGAGDTSADRER